MNNGETRCKKTCAVEQKKNQLNATCSSHYLGVSAEIYIIYCALGDQAQVKRKIQQRALHSG